MQIYPAIDLMGGRCVRLEKGAFATKREYSDKPVDVAQGFAAAGADWLHMVDLDGAKDGNAAQSATILQVAKNTALKIQTGGGIRTRDHVERLLDGGIERVVVGSLAVKDQKEVTAWLETYGPERITLAFDVRVDRGRAMVALHGWQDMSAVALDDIIAAYLARGARHFLVTDIDKDGMLKGPNVELYARLAERFPEAEVQASAGVSSLEDVSALRRAGAKGAIIGKAIYEGRVSVKELFDAR